MGLSSYESVVTTYKNAFTQPNFTYVLSMVHQKVVLIIKLFDVSAFYRLGFMCKTSDRTVNIYLFGSLLPSTHTSIDP